VRDQKKELPSEQSHASGRRVVGESEDAARLLFICHPEELVLACWSSGQPARGDAPAPGGPRFKAAPARPRAASGRAPGSRGRGAGQMRQRWRMGIDSVCRIIYFVNIALVILNVSLTIVGGSLGLF